MQSRGFPLAPPTPPPFTCYYTLHSSCKVTRILPDQDFPKPLFPLPLLVLDAFIDEPELIPNYSSIYIVQIMYPSILYVAFTHDISTTKRLLLPFGEA